MPGGSVFIAKARPTIETANAPRNTSVGPSRLSPSERLSALAHTASITPDAIKISQATGLRVLAESCGGPLARGLAPLAEPATRTVVAVAGRIELTTPWSKAMGLRVPIVNAPMGGAAGGRLAAAVSTAGGLGMIGMGSSATAAVLRHELAELGSATPTSDPPFGIGLVHWVMTAQPEMFDVALAAQPTLLSVSFGEDWEWVRRAHDSGVAVTTQVATVAAGLRAAAAGVDVVVARGAEGGGHGEPSIGTLPLLAGLLDELDGSGVPVLAAGGVSSARAVAAVLAAGADGAWVGTAFAACTEALGSADGRAQLIRAQWEDTITTTEFDVAQGYPWPTTLPERVLLDQGAVTPVNAGQGVGSVQAECSAAEVIAQLCARLAGDSSTARP